MKVDLDGLAASIKEAIKGDRARELRFMVDEMVRWIRELEANVGGGDTAIAQLEQENEALAGEAKRYVDSEIHLVCVIQDAIDEATREKGAS